MPRLSRIRYGIDLEGPQVKLELVEGAVLTIEAVGFFTDAFAPGAAVQFSQGDKKSHLITYSQIVRETLEEYADQVPFDATFRQQTSAAGRKFWTIE